VSQLIPGVSPRSQTLLRDNGLRSLSDLQSVRACSETL
jgi:hypothetical protein